MESGKWKLSWFKHKGRDYIGAQILDSLRDRIRSQGKQHFHKKLKVKAAEKGISMMDLFTEAIRKIDVQPLKKHQARREVQGTE